MCLAAAGAALGGMGGLSTALSVVGQVFGMVSSMQQSRAQQAQIAAQQQQAAYQAQVGRNNAQIELYRANQEQREGQLRQQQLALKTAQDVGKATNKYGASNVVVGEGTPAGYIGDIAAMGQSEQAAEGRSTANKVWDYRQRAQNFMAQAGMSDLQAGKSKAQVPGINSQSGGLLGGGGTVSSKWASYA